MLGSVKRAEQYLALTESPIRLNWLKKRRIAFFKEEVMEDVQAAFGVAITKQALDFEASMSAALISGSFEKSAELQASMARSAGLAAEGIGANLNIEV